MQAINKIGKAIKCAETGVIFLGKKEGISTNYAYNDKGEFFSNQGVFIRENKALLNRQKTVAYTNQDGTKITTWKGQELAKITYKRTINNGCTGKAFAIDCTDNHGGKWFARTSLFGQYVTLHPKK